MIADSLLGNSVLLTVDDPGHTSLGISPFGAGPITGDYLVDPSIAPSINGVACPSLLDVTGLNWIEFGAPPPDGPPPMMQFGADYRHQLMSQIAYQPLR